MIPDLSEADRRELRRSLLCAASDGAVCRRSFAPAELTTRRVIVGVLLMILALQAFAVETWVHPTDLAQGGLEVRGGVPRRAAARGHTFPDSGSLESRILVLD